MFSLLQRGFDKNMQVGNTYLYYLAPRWVGVKDVVLPFFPG